MVALIELTHEAIYIHVITTSKFGHNMDITNRIIGANQLNNGGTPLAAK